MLPVEKEIVKWKTKLIKCQHLTVVIGMQVNFGLEISIYKYIFASF
jgi:hypothetical protein